MCDRICSVVAGRIANVVKVRRNGAIGGERRSLPIRATSRIAFLTLEPYADVMYKFADFYVTARVAGDRCEATPSRMSRPLPAGRLARDFDRNGRMMVRSARASICC